VENFQKEEEKHFNKLTQLGSIRVYLAVGNKESRMDRLLALIPWLGIAVELYLFVYGKRLAWKKGEWQTFDNFYDSEYGWSFAFWILYPFAIFLWTEHCNDFVCVAKSATLLFPEVFVYFHREIFEAYPN